MDIKSKKKQLANEFNQNQELIQRLANRNQQIIGYLQALEEQEKEVKKDNEKKGK